MSRLARSVILGLALAGPDLSAEGLAWPQATRETRPWTRWWWMGSTVDRPGLTAALEVYRRAGLGGVEVTPIYGVRGEEDRFLTYLSPAWMRMLDHTLAETRRLDLGVDMATGTGWPFGGPGVGADEASRSLAHRIWNLHGGEGIGEPIRLRQEALVRALGKDVSRGIADLAFPVEANRNLQDLALEQVKYPRDLPLLALVAYPGGAEPIDLTRRVDADGGLDWVAPVGGATVYGVFLGWHGKLVERAAPGGEGNVIDHFATGPIRSYLGRFDRAFAGHDLSGLRAFFNDSYEVDDATGQADGTPRLFAEFEKRRGYDLRRHLPALFGQAGEDESARVLADYRETVSDLLLDTFTAEWRRWAAGRGHLVRNQAHGSPASILDLYAASDIPETEGQDLMRAKWATSAAHVSGKRLVSAEAATWLGEHFLSTLGDVRRHVDRFFLAGVNHVVWHGTAYSPPGEAWPGRLFYAAVHFAPQNSWWTDFGALNQYVTRVQSFLQAGVPDPDVLLYYPLYDSLARRGSGLLSHFGGDRSEPEGTAFEAAADLLQNRGFAFDFLSDRQLLALRLDGGRLLTGGLRYKTLVLPESRFLPLVTLERLLGLARQGATVIVYRDLPAEVSGARDLETQRKSYRSLVAGLGFEKAGEVGEARVGAGRVLRGHDLETLLARAGVARETLVDQGLQYVRRRRGDEQTYFIANPGERPFRGLLSLGTAAGSVAVFEPMRGASGYARIRPAGGGRTEVYAQLGPGESLILAARRGAAEGDPYPYHEASGDPAALHGPWTLRFLEGGPELPPEARLDTLGSWTLLPNEAVRRFAGTARYSASFSRPRSDAPAFRLDLGRVHESARVRLNDREIASLLGPSYVIDVDARDLLATNRLEVLVSNLMANRIADLDRRGVPWKKFYNVNFPSRLRENRGEDGLFTAATWEPLPSGLLGPVTLTPLRLVP